MIKYILIAFACVIGVALAAGLIVLVVTLIKKISQEMARREKKAKTVLGDREIYLKKQMFEELAYIEKYKKELEEGKWPREMNQKFEYDEPNSDDIICEVTENGFILRHKKRFLRLKECFKKKNNDVDKKKDNDDDKKDNDNNKQ